MALMNLPDPSSNMFKISDLFWALYYICENDYGTDDMDEVADFVMKLKECIMENCIPGVIPDVIDSDWDPFVYYNVLTDLLPREVYKRLPDEYWSV